MKNLLAESNRIGKHMAKMAMTPTPRRPKADLDIVAYQMEAQTKRFKRGITSSLRAYL